MKVILLSLAYLLFSNVSLRAQEAGTLEALSDKYGFRDAQFESPVTSFKGLVYQTGEKSTKLYTRPTDSKKIGGAQLSAIYYSFYKGKLAAVKINTKGLSNSRALLAALTAQYGEPEQPNEFIKNYEWLGNRVKMVFKQNSITDAAVVLFSNYMMVQQSEDEAAAAKKAASDL